MTLIRPVPDPAEIAERQARLARELTVRMQALGELKPLREMTELGELTLGRPALSASEMTDIVGQGLLLVSTFYVHLAGKRTLHAIDPAQALRNLRNEITDRRATPDAMRETEFHDRMTEIFVGLRDRHTSYYLPRPYRRTLVFLPFLVEAVKDDPFTTRYLVTKVAGTTFDDTEFRVPARDGEPPVEVTHWNGVPIGRAVARNGERSAGANPAARLARGLDRLTFRWLGLSTGPDEDWIDLTYTVGGQTYVRRFEWLAVRRPDDRPVVAARETEKASSLGRDQEGEWIRDVKERLFFDPDAQGTWEQRLPDGTVAYRTHRRAEGEPVYGYLRIYSFAVEDDRVGAFVAGVREILRDARPEGLIVDIRGNPGGNVVAAEELLPLFSSGAVDREGLQFLNTPEAVKLGVQLYGEAVMADRLDEARSTAAPFVSSPPFARRGRRVRALVPNQVYQGPVVLVVDANCYSASEIFAAGMQDHGLATIIGTAKQTGGGGGNVWAHDLISQLCRDRTRLRPLAQEASFDVAVRRTTRAGSRAGVALEDMGVVVRGGDARPLTSADVLRRNEDLLGFAIERLEAGPRHRVQATYRRRTFTLSSSEVERVDVYVDDRPVTSVLEPDGKQVVLPPGVPRPTTALFLGLAEGQVRTSFRWRRR